MLLMLDLICSIIKYSFLLTIVRLASTAFGWEFGVSRQYLRFLELLFRVGQKRIDKVKSDNKLATIGNINSTTLEDDESDSRPPSGRRAGLSSLTTTSLSSSSHRYESQYESESRRLRTTGGQTEALTTTGCHSSSSSPSRPSQLSLTARTTTTTTTSTHLQQPKSRRISTPDGPPIFLLDDDDDDDYNDDDDCEDEIDDGEGEGEREREGGERDERLDRLKVAKLRSRPIEQQQEFHLQDTCRLVVKGVSAIIDDQVTKRFSAEELASWNLLTRSTAKNYQFMSGYLGLYWFCGCLIRYSVLLPLRIMFTLMGFCWLATTTSLVGLIPARWRSGPYRLITLMAFRMLACGFTSRLKFHNTQFKARNGDICVANHTSPIDVVLLACDNCYALVGQRHGGLLGILELALSRATNHVWFDRSEMRDRQLVTKRLREHVASKTNLPVLIFPEGTCINNSAVMMFRKGSFETTDRVCPVAIKYDSRFGDPFWNSSKQSYLQYLLLLMSSWAIKCDVWYLEPMERIPHESSAEFANRVKAEIAKRANLVDLAWDGQLKRTLAKEVWKHQQQEDYAKRLKLE